MSDLRTAPRLLVPETVQTSGMDCGPAALRSLLAGMRVRASYGRLREACQTDVDGTAIEALEQAARALGLEVAQLMLPADHVAVPSARALPSLAVARLPDGMPHFVVAWRRHGPLVQVMDPATGRRFVRGRALLGMLYVHEQAVPAAAWGAFSEAPTLREPLVERIQELDVSEHSARRLLQCAVDAGPEAVAALDAEVRARASARALGNGRMAGGADALRALSAAVDDPVATRDRLPPEAWFARPLDRRPGDGEAHVLLRGAVVVRSYGRAAEPPSHAALSADLRAAVTERAPRPGRRLLAAARAEGRVPLPTMVLGGCGLAGGAIVEAALLRDALDRSDPQEVLLAVAGLGALLTTVGIALSAVGLAVGRRLEIGLRRSLLLKLPRLPDRYLRSRAPADMAERAHALHVLRRLPMLLVGVLSSATETVLVAGALCILDPGGAPLVVAATVLVLATALIVQWPLREREQREREHSGALGQTTLDALLGVLPLRAHGGEAAIEVEQRARLANWREAAGASVRARSAAALAQMACAIGLTIPVVLTGLPRLDEPGEQLLFVLWAIMLPLCAEQLSQVALQWPGLRALALRLAEPLDAPDAPGWDLQATARDEGRGVSIELDRACVRATGHVVLEPTSLRFETGEHIALVGASGAGKSTLCALVLGLVEPSQGRVLVDDAPLDRAAARALWPSVAWVDSQVRIWNRSLADNLAPGAADAVVDELLAAAELEQVGKRVCDQPLGADGGLLSGGEGQRVRLGRAFGQSDVRLAVLDEALRGLDRRQRHRLLARARERWPDATIVCATHDVEDALAFDRVIVLEGGRVVEDGPPGELLHADGARLQALIDAERDLRAELDAGRGWRRLRVEDGTLREDAVATVPPGTVQAGAPDGADRPKRAAQTSAEDGPTPVPDPAHGVPTRAPVLAALAVFVAATAARFAAFALSWAVVGAAIVAGDVSGSRLAPWALLLGATVLLAVLATWSEGRVAVGLGTLLRHRLLRGAFALDPGWIRREGPGRVLGRTLEVEGVSRLAIAGGLDAVTAAVQVAVAAAVLLAVGPARLAAAFIALVLLAGAATAVVAVRRRAAWTQARLDETDQLLEAIAGQRTRLVQGDSTDDGTRDARLARYLSLSRSADRPVAVLGALPHAALTAGLLGLALAAGDASVGELAAALGGVLLAAEALGMVAAATDTLTIAALARRSLQPILAAAHGTGPAADATGSAQTTGGRSASGAREGGAEAGADSTGGLIVEGLAVDRDGQRVLDAIDLALPPGDRVVLTGASGAGKSTLAAALAGLLPVAGGTLALAGAPEAPGTRAWRARVQLLPQHHDNHVLQAPLAFNLLLGRRWPPTEKDLEDASELCEELELGALLRRMPAGIGQHVGETGWRLSQGERARVQLARALLAGPDVLILDEPLGALDPVTGRLVLDVVRRRARTLVLISQE